ncbi:MAG: hypothetical protein NWS46_01315 [Cyclobacteriaceae bacterium]|nr:hypothetical protein [Cyclobacteriaceae bacterium]
MDIELENLINMALADGVVTEKERAIILRKAEALGEDIDEVEMILEGKRHQLEVSKPKQKEKVGNIKTCPACGASVKAMSLSCSDCDHEFSNLKGNNSLSDLMNKLSSIKGDTNSYENQAKRVNIIKDHPISNDKETMFEFLTYMSSKVLSVNTVSDEINAYQGRAIEIISKLRLICSNDLLLMNQLDKIENQMSRKKSKNGLVYIIQWVFGSIAWCFFTYLMIATIARIFGAHWWPF